MTKRHFTAAVLASTFLLPAAGAWAQDNDKYIQMDIQVTDWVDELLGEGFDEAHRNLLKTAALQMSVARNCDGFIVDNGKLEAVLQRAMEEHEESDEDYETVSAATSMALGAFLALGQAVSALDNEGFCAGAASEREAKVGSSDNIIWASE